MSHRTCRPAALRAALVLALMTFALPTAGAGETPASAGTPVRGGNPQVGPGGTGLSDYAPLLKRMQQRLLMEGARRRMEQARAYQRLRRTHPELAKAAIGRKQPRDWAEAGGPQGAGTGAAFAREALPAAIEQALAPNLIVNNRAGDNATAGQAEQMIVALGQHVLVAWNDGEGFFQPPGHQNTQGWGYSADGGLTYKDGGIPPMPPGWLWTSDPVLTVNEKTGEFWYCAMVQDTLYPPTKNGIAVAKAQFVADTVQWSAPVLVRSTLSSSMLFDKPWMVVDSLSNRLYLTYSVFTTRDTIVFQRSSPGGATWDSPQRLSSNAEAGLVQGSRPVVGPNGEVYVVWYSINLSLPYSDWMMIRKSTNQGLSFGTAVTAVSLFANYGNGAPGFNRGQGLSFPAIAVDRSTGPHRGRVYVSWNESINFYDDDLGTLSPLTETEPNDTPATADPIAIGQIARGSILNGADLDYWKFHGNAGQTVILLADSLASTLDLSLRLFCTDGTTRLAFSAFGAGGNDLLVFTLPVTGDYYMRLASFASSTGPYKISTGFDSPSPGERGRDHRDVFVTWSDDGTTWSTPARSSDSPAGYDDWLPEVAVAGDNGNPLVGSGKAYCLWYDWRDSPPATCGGLSHVYLSRSDDGGATWIRVGTVTDVQTNWTSAPSNIAPNQGDYLALFANSSNLYAAWADGRNGDPDVFATTIPLLVTPAEVALVSARAEAGRVVLTWYAGARAGFTATVERCEAATGFAAIGAVTADGNGRLTFEDRDVTPNTRYAYRLAWDEGGVRRATPEVWVEVPVAPTFALHGAQPNPAVNGAFVAFSLPDATPATLELFDVTGRLVSGKQVTGPGAQVVDLSGGRSLEPGLYLVRLTRGGRSLTARMIVVR